FFSTGRFTSTDREIPEEVVVAGRSVVVLHVSLGEHVEAHDSAGSEVATAPSPVPHCRRRRQVAWLPVIVVPVTATTLTARVLARRSAAARPSGRRSIRYNKSFVDRLADEGPMSIPVVDQYL